MVRVKLKIQNFWNQYIIINDKIILYNILLSKLINYYYDIGYHRYSALTDRIIGKLIFGSFVLVW